MSNWYHVVCFHKGEHSQSRPVHVCDIEDDGGSQGKAHDKLAPLLRESPRDIGVRLRAYNYTTSAHWLRAPGVDSQIADVKAAMEIAVRQGRAKLHELARVDIAPARNRPGHEWAIECGVCAETVEVSDARLLAALNRIRCKPKRPTRELTVDQQDTTETGTDWTAAAVSASVVRLSELQSEINRGVS